MHITPSSYEFSENRSEYAICIIDLGRLTPLVTCVFLQKSVASSPTPPSAFHSFSSSSSIIELNLKQTSEFCTTETFLRQILRSGNGSLRNYNSAELFCRPRRKLKLENLWFLENNVARNTSKLQTLKLDKVFRPSIHS